METSVEYVIFKSVGIIGSSEKLKEEHCVGESRTQQCISGGLSNTLNDPTLRLDKPHICADMLKTHAYERGLRHDGQPAE